MSGSWKDLLLAMLANLNHEIGGIREHDGSHVFDPARWPAVALAQVEIMQPQFVPAVREPCPGYETEPTEPSEAQGPYRFSAL